MLYAVCTRALELLSGHGGANEFVVDFEHANLEAS